MVDFLSNIKRDLAETSNEHATITLSRKDVEMLVKSYENKSEILMRHIADERKEVIKRLSEEALRSEPFTFDKSLDEFLDEDDKN